MAAEFYDLKALELTMLLFSSCHEFDILLVSKFSHTGLLVLLIHLEWYFIELAGPEQLVEYVLFRDECRLMIFVLFNILKFLKKCYSKFWSILFNHKQPMMY